MRHAALLILFIAVPATVCAQSTWYVPDDFSTIQGALSDDDVLNGHTIIVRAGTYVENVDFEGKGITLKSESGPYHTLIDGNQSGSVVTMHLWKENGALSGFTITNGSGTLSSTACMGGGINMSCLAGYSTLVSQNIIAGNGCEQSGLLCLGGGIYCTDGTPMIVGNRIMDNRVEGSYSWGGGMSLYNCEPAIRKNVIMHNSAVGIAGASSGGGIEYSNLSVLWRELIMGSNIIMYNDADWGGGVSASSSLNAGRFSIFDNIISHNTARISGGGMGCSSGVINVYLTNNTLADNTALDSGGGIYFNHLNPTIENTILWNNHAPQGKEIYFSGNNNHRLTLRYSDVDGGKSSIYMEPGSNLNWSYGMINGDPLFLDAPAGDYHLTWLSSCRNVGDNLVGELPTEDYEGNPRIADNTADMGADEFYPHLYYTGHATPSGTLQVKFVGSPGTLINGVIVGVNIFDPPLPCDFGLWYMDNPFQVITGLGVIPPIGIAIFPGTIPASPPAPYTFYLQGVIDMGLTNLCPVDVQ